MSKRGAPASYRGYRLQALYTLMRVLAPGVDASLVFHPEGNEDLDIEQQDGSLLEAIQVKSYTNLVLSNLSPEKETSFFRRVLNLLQLPGPPRIKLVNFGSIGEEMRLAWQGDDACREGIAGKLGKKGYDETGIQAFFENIELVELVEVDEEQALFTQLRDQLVGIDPNSAFDLLQYWLYRQSENRARLNHADMIEKVQGVGRFLSERHSHHREWFTSIQPIEEIPIAEEQIPQLQEEFYAGVSARYEHILTDLDFRREQKMAEIGQAFDLSNVVIVHAASGQGKTTLAYRYLHEAYPDQWRFSVELIENRRHALSIATALAGHARSVQAPMAIYVDVSPSDPDWPELVQRLAREPYVQILVTIREEDFRRANIANSFEFTPIDLVFDETEAQLIYNRAKEAGHPLAHRNFEDAWHMFGCEGPLMEFVYLLTQTRTLRQRLEEQVNRIRHEVREKVLSPNELELLRLVAVATAYDARVYLSGLIAHLDLPEPGLTLDLFEKEYLLKVTPDNQYVVGLHPIRSRILAQHLTESGVHPWLTTAQQVLTLTPEADWELFILQAFLDRSNEFDQILELVEGLNPSTWMGLAGALKCLLWAGIKRYVEENWDAAEASRNLFGPGWIFILDLNFAGDEAPSLEGWWRNLGDLIPEEKQAEIEHIRRSQTPKENAFQNASAWLASQNETPDEPISGWDWRSTTETLYWASRLGQGAKVGAWLSDEALSSVVQEMSLVDLSEVSLGLYCANPTRCWHWLQEHWIHLEAMLTDELDIIALVETEDMLSIHFLTYPEDDLEKTNSVEADGERSKKSLHDQTIERLQIVRQLFPQHDKYGSQGYGHQIPGMGFDHDDTTKSGVDKEYLLPRWPLWANGIATGLVQYQFRSAHWDEYLQQIIETRKRIVACFLELIRGVAQYFRREKPYNLLAMEVFDTGEWEQCRELANDRALLPKTAVDPWGMAQPEGKLQRMSMGHEKLLPTSILEQVYKPYLETERGYFSGITNFMGQSLSVMATNHHAGKLPEGSPQKLAALENLKAHNINTDLAFLSTYNLDETRNALPVYQRSFRSLFGGRFDPNALVELEKREVGTIDMVWQLWYYFAYHPRTAAANPLKKIPARIEAAVQGLRRKYDEGLEQMQDEGVHAYRIETDLLWEESPTVWILFDLDDPIQLYQRRDELIYALRSAVGLVDASDITHSLIKIHFEYTVIIPTIQGRVINPLVWPLQTLLTITRDEPLEEKPWAYMPQPIPTSLLEDLGVAIWNHPDIDLADQLAASVEALALFTAMLGQLSGMPDPTDAGAERLQEFMSDRSEELSALLQSFFDAGATLLDRFNDLSEREVDQRQELVEALGLLSETYKQVVPLEDPNGQQPLSLDRLAEYAERLLNIISQVEDVRLLWITDTLNRI